MWGRLWGKGEAVWKRALVPGLATLALLLALSVSAIAQSTSATNCGGAEPNVQPDGVVNALYGTSGDDFAVVPDSLPYYSNGGTDTICDTSGNVIAVVVTDELEPISPPTIPDVVPDLTTLDEQESGVGPTAP